MKTTIRLIVNGESKELKVDPRQTLVDLIRDELGLTGTKKVCGTGDCGACTIILDGKPVNSCLILGIEADGLEITTIEALKIGAELHPIQDTFVRYGAVQCGFCTPGMILSAKALLDKNPKPNEHDVRIAISGNLCRCTGYQKIVEAIISLSQGKTAPRTEEE